MLSPALVLREIPAHRGLVGWDGGPFIWDRLVDLDEHLAGIVERDEQAFARWIALAEPTIRASLRSFAAQVDTEAVLQETLLRVWQSAPRVERDRKPNSLLRFSFRVARNLAISEVRRARLRPAEADDMERKLNALSGGDGPEPPDPMLRRLIKLCRDKLPPKPQRALDLRLSSSGGTSDKELAAKLGMTKNTFLQNFTRARKLLAKCLSDNGVSLEGCA
jgi:RNA polymerase sigma-70 factor (ECF subfamily)